MVVDVAEVDDVLRRDERQRPVRQLVEDLALRGADVAEVDELALEREELLERVGVGPADDPVLELVDRVLDPVEDRVVAVDDVVERGPTAGSRCPGRGRAPRRRGGAGPCGDPRTRVWTVRRNRPPRTMSISSTRSSRSQATAKTTRWAMPSVSSSFGRWLRSRMSSATSGWSPSSAATGLHERRARGRPGRPSGARSTRRPRAGAPRGRSASGARRRASARSAARPPASLGEAAAGAASPGCGRPAPVRGAVRGRAWARRRRPARVRLRCHPHLPRPSRRPAAGSSRSIRGRAPEREPRRDRQGGDDRPPRGTARPWSRPPRSAAHVSSAPTTSGSRSGPVGERRRDDLAVGVGRAEHLVGVARSIVVEP